MHPFEYSKHFLKDFFRTYGTVLRLIVPVVVVLKILSYTPIIMWVGIVLKPVMAVLGLPPEAGVVLATTMTTSIYSGMLAWISFPVLMNLSVAQATTITAMMLYAHTLLIELQIVKKAGVSLVFSFFWRICGGFLFGFLIHSVCHYFHLFQGHSILLFKPTHIDVTIWDWANTQLFNFAKIGSIIFALMLMMSLLRYFKITHFLEAILRPVLGKIGISVPAISLSVIGLVLGLFYGGALIIREAKQGVLSEMDVFFSLALLNLCHSLVEDSILGVMMGGQFYVLVIARFLFAYILVWFLFRTTQFLESFRQGKQQSTM